MEKITLTFLGTGSSVPTAKRNHTAILLSYKNENILIDCGEGTQRQFKYAGLSPNKITKLLITHWHGDHILGIPGLFQTLHMNDYSKVLEIFGPRKTEYYLDLLNHLVKLKINFHAEEISHGKFFENEEFYLEAREMEHDTPALAYAFVIKEKRRLDRKKLAKLKLPNSPLLKQLQQGKDITYDGKKIKSSQVSYTEPGRKVTIILDTSPNPNTIEIAKDVDLLVCESSFSEEESQMAKERFHLTSKDAAEIAKKAKAKKLILTHISQRYEHKPKIILDEAKKVFKNTIVVKDLDVVEV